MEEKSREPSLGNSGQSSLSSRTTTINEDSNDTVLHRMLRENSQALQNQLRNDREQKKKEKYQLEREREELAKTLTLDDVKFNEAFTDIVSIKGLPIKDFKDKMLIQFCRKNEVKVPSGQCEGKVSGKNNCQEKGTFI